MPQSRLLISSLLTFTILAALSAEQKEVPVVPVALIPAAPILSVEKALDKFTLAEGFIIEPVASEPLVKKPVAFDIDDQGRLWVCEMIGYMPDEKGSDEDKPQGNIVILEDTDKDGKVDKRSVFLKNLLLPRAITLVEDGILFADQNALYHVTRDGDQPTDKPTVIDPDYAKGGNVEHKANGLLHGLDNWLYSAKSDRRYRKIEGKWVMQKTQFRGQWGISQDDYGRLFFTGNSNLLHGSYIAPQIANGNPGVKMGVREIQDIGSNEVWPGRVTPGVNRAYMMRVNGFDNDILNPKTFKLINATGVAGTVIYRGTNFPTKWYGRAFSCESCVQLLKATDITEDKEKGKLLGTHSTGKKEFLTSTDERFRPVNVFNAPDGSLYLVDFYHGIIQHRDFLSNYLRQQSLDRGLEKPGDNLGRIYRIRYEKRPLRKTQNLEAFSSNDLTRQLISPNGWNRDMAQRLLVGRGDRSVLPMLEKLLSMDDYPLGQIKAVWVLEGLHELKTAHILTLLKSKNPKLVCTALWASLSITEAAELIKLRPALASLETEDREVRIYLARALGRFGPGPAFETLVDLLKNHRDEPYVRQMAVAGLNGHELAFKNAVKGIFGDGNLEKWLSEGATGSARKIAAESSLTGEHLASFKRGRELFNGIAVCGSCHGSDGAGMPSLGPPLNQSEWVTENPERLVAIILHGISGPITVNGIKYQPSADMPGFYANTQISDQNLADIATYIRHEWENSASAVSADFVKKIRASTKDRAGKAYSANKFKN